jgi:hypothetical protein
VKEKFLNAQPVASSSLAAIEIKKNEDEEEKMDVEDV